MIVGVSRTAEPVRAASERDALPAAAWPVETAW